MQTGVHRLLLRHGAAVHIIVGIVGLLLAPSAHALLLAERPRVGSCARVSVVDGHRLHRRRAGPTSQSDKDTD